MNFFTLVSETLGILQKSNDPSFDFYSRSYLHSAICNLLQKEKELNFERVVEGIPKKIGSRSAILVVLSDGLSKGYFLKVGSEIDKRLRIYKLSDQFNSDLTETFRETIEKVL